DYGIACKKSSNAQFTSDLNTTDDEHVSTKRKTVPSRRYMADSTDSEEDTIVMKKPPVLKYDNQSQRNSKKTSKATTDNNNLHIISNQLVTPSSVGTLSVSEFRPEAVIRSKSTTCSCTCQLHQSKNENMLREILRQLTTMKASLLQFNEDVQKLHGNKTKEFYRENFLNNFHLPINGEMELKELDSYLKSDINFKGTVEDISRIGGSNIYDFVRRSLSVLITDEVAKEYSYYGVKKKKIFKSLRLCDLLLEAAAISNLKSDKKATEAIKKWLRRAKERHDAKK
ncbi:hypothetical protein PPYR_14981, partial [Photinus pyralis]